MISSIAFFLLGFYILIKGADILIDGASSVARKFRLSEWLIGLTIVGIGTSIPEFAVTLSSSLRGDELIGLGTIIGSNTANILFILGIAAVIFPFRLKEEWVRRDLPWNIVAVFAAAAAAFLLNSPRSAGLFIDRPEGFMLLALFFIWMYLVIKNGKRQANAETEGVRLIALPLSLLMILGGLVGVVLGGEWVVRSALAMSQFLGLSEIFIGLTVVGIGTSLPELVVIFVAAWKKHSDLAVACIIGSNIFDFLFILGIAAAVKPVPFSPELGFDIMVTAAAALLMLAAVFVGQKYVLKRWQGATFAALYAVYLILIFMREGFNS